MKSFSDLGIPTSNFSGKKIEIEEVIDCDITVTAFKIGPSKYPDSRRGNGLCLTLQIIHEGEERIVFTGSTILQDQVSKASAMDGIPFTTTIITLKPKGYKFT